MSRKRRIIIASASLTTLIALALAAYLYRDWNEYGSRVETDLFSLGQVASSRGDCPKAIRYYQTLLKKDPRHSTGLEFLAECQAKIGDLPSAIVSYRELLKLDPSERHKARLKELQSLAPMQGSTPSGR